MNKLYFKLISILLVVTVSYLFFAVQQAHAFFIGAIIGAIVAAVSASVGVAAALIGTIIGTVIAGVVAVVTGVAFIVTSFLCGSPFVGGEQTGGFIGNCGGGFAVNINAADSAGCNFQGHIAFFNPSMNKGYVVTQSTDYYKQCYGNIKGPTDQCYDAEGVAPDQRYADGPGAAGFNWLTAAYEQGSPGCTIKDPNGGYVAHPEYILSGEMQIPGYNVNIPTVCEKIKSKKTCEFSDTANDDASKQVAIYRFTLPATVSGNQLVYWLFDLESQVGGGLTSVSGYFSGWAGNAISSDANIIATVPYSQICEGDICQFIDQSVPPDSYVVYAAKILGGFNYGVQQEQSFNVYYLTGYGSPPETPDIIWTNNVACGVGANKFLNTGGASPTLFPPPSLLLRTNRHQPNAANAAQAQWNQFNSSPNQKAFVGPLKSSACPTSTLPTVDLTTNLTFALPNPIVLNWTSNNASSCAATAGDWSGDKAIGGQEQLLKPLGNYTFTLTCTNPNGSASDTANTSVINALLQGPQCDFTANPSSIIPPQTSTLSWECINANSCEIDQSIGSVNPVSGNTEVSPTETTTYNLNCQGAGGGTSASFPVTVSVGFSSWLREILPR